MKQILIYTFFISMFFIPLHIQAETVILNDGTVIVGEIESESEYEIHLRTAWGTDEIIERIYIREIRPDAKPDETNYVQLHLKDGSIIQGKIISKDEDKYILYYDNVRGEIEVDRSIVREEIPVNLGSKSEVTSETKSGKPPIRIVNGEVVDPNEPKAGVPAESTDGTGAASIDARKLEYYKRAIIVQNLTDSNSRTERWNIRKGPFIISEEDFLMQIEKPERAGEIRGKRVRNRIGFGVCMGVGAGLALGGLITTWAVPSDKNALRLSLSISMVATGLTLALISAFVFDIQGPYMTYGEAETHAAKYNLELRQELGLKKSQVEYVPVGFLDSQLRFDLLANAQLMSRSPLDGTNILPFSIGYTFRF